MGPFRHMLRRSRHVIAQLGWAAMAFGRSLRLRWRGAVGSMLFGLALLPLGMAGVVWPALLERRRLRVAMASFGALFWWPAARRPSAKDAPSAADLSALLNIARLGALEDQLPALAEHTCELLGAQLALIATYDEALGELSIAAGAGCAAGDSWIGRRLAWPVPELAGQPIMISAPLRDVRLAPLRDLLLLAAPRMLLALPLLAHAQPFGLLLIGSFERRDASDARVLQLAQLAAGYIAAAVANMRLSAQAQRALRARATVLGTISHEFRTPITVVLGFAELYQEGLLGPVAPEQHEALEAIERNATRLLRLVDGMVELARAEAGELDLTLGTVNLELCLSEVQELSQSQLAEQSCSLRIDLSAPLPYVRADVLWLRRSLLGLLCYLAQSAPGHPICIRARDSAGAALVEICAPGYVLPEPAPAQFFAVFPPPDGGEQGVGMRARLGLMLGKHMLDAMGAQIEAVALPNGTLGLVLTLPAARE